MIIIIVSPEHQQPWTAVLALLRLVIMAYLIHGLKVPTTRITSDVKMVQLWDVADNGNVKCKGKLTL